MANGPHSPAAGDTTDTGSMAEAYAIAAPKAGAVAAVNAIQAAGPVPELKGKTTTIKAVAIIEWPKLISKHQSIKGAALGEAVLKMSKLFAWPAEENVDKAWELASLRTKTGLRIKMQICWERSRKASQEISGPSGPKSGSGSLGV